MSLGDAVAALFRGQPRRKPPAGDPPAIRHPFKTATSDDLLFRANRNSPESVADYLAPLIGPH